MIHAAGSFPSTIASRAGWALLALLLAAAVTAGAAAEDANEQPSMVKSDATDRVMITRMPEQSAAIRAILQRALGAGSGPISATGENELWSIPRSQTKSLTTQIEQLGGRVTTLRDDWSEILKRHAGPTSLWQDDMLKTLRAAPEAVGVGVLKAPTSDPAPAGPDGGRERATWPPKDLTASTIVIPINATTDITLERVGVTVSPQGRTWSGFVQETGERALLMWWKDGRLSGLVGYRGHIYTVQNIGGEVHAMVESDPAKMPPDHAAASATPSGNPSARDSIRRAQPEPEPAPAPPPPEVKPFPDAERLALEAKLITIDVMMLYTKKAASRYIRDPADLIALSFEQANETFANSGIGKIRLRLVHTQLVDYDETGAQHFEHLYRLVDGTGPFKEARRLRNEKRADIVGLIMDDPSGCGLSTRVAPDPDEAYFVVHHSCAAITITIAHEIGHILGARHDRRIDASNTPFAHGHGFVNGKWRDIMSYQESCGGCPRIPFWSNPRVLYKGEPTGTAAEDNARVILEQAERVSQFR